MEYKKIYQVEVFPVYVSLKQKNPWGNLVKVNNMIIDFNKIKISNKKDLDKLLPIEKYIVIESIEDEQNLTEEKIKPTNGKKSKK